MRPLDGDGETAAEATSALFGPNIAATARCVSRSNSPRGGLVSNSAGLAPGLAARPGRRRTSIVKEGMGRFKLVLDDLGVLARITCPSTTLRGEPAYIKRQALLIDVKTAVALIFDPVEQARIRAVFQMRRHWRQRGAGAGQTETHAAAGVLEVWLDRTARHVAASAPGRDSIGFMADLREK